jgi:hypothetical protein
VANDSTTINAFRRRAAKRLRDNTTGAEDLL